MALTGITENDVLQQNTIIRSRSTTYTVHNMIGTGRFSRVYNASVMGTGNAVVIKALNNSCSSKRFDRKLYIKELDLLNRLKFSRLRARFVQLRDAVLLKSGKICFVMERLGTTLQAVLHNIGPLPISVCRPIVRQIAQGTRKTVIILSKTRYKHESKFRVIHYTRTWRGDQRFVASPGGLK